MKDRKQIDEEAEQFMSAMKKLMQPEMIETIESKGIDRDKHPELLEISEMFRKTAKHYANRGVSMILISNDRDSGMTAFCGQEQDIVLALSMFLIEYQDNDIVKTALKTFGKYRKP